VGPAEGPRIDPPLLQGHAPCSSSSTEEADWIAGAGSGRESAPRLPQKPARDRHRRRPTGLAWWLRPRPARMAAFKLRRWRHPPGAGRPLSWPACCIRLCLDQGLLTAAETPPANSRWGAAGPCRLRDCLRRPWVLGAGGGGGGGRRGPARIEPQPSAGRGRNLFASSPLQDSSGG